VRQADVTPLFRRASPWRSLVAVSTAIVVGGAIIIGAWWAATREERVSSYAVNGSLNGVTLDLGDANADIIGAGERPSLRVRRTDRSAFGRRAVTQRDLSGGVLRIRSRCPSSVLGSCSASYRLMVPDNVPVTVRTGAGDVRFDGYKGSARIDTTDGSIAVTAFCGFALQARAETGAVRATASCPPERMELRSASGDVRAVVPPGRYRVDADSDTGRRTVEGVTAADDAPFSIQALSGAGDVDVLGQP
jgi:Putative adhesin